MSLPVDPSTVDPSTADSTEPPQKMDDLTSAETMKNHFSSWPAGLTACAQFSIDRTAMREACTARDLLWLISDDWLGLQMRLAVDEAINAATVAADPGALLSSLCRDQSNVAIVSGAWLKTQDGFDLPRDQSYLSRLVCSIVDGGAAKP